MGVFKYLDASLRYITRADANRLEEIGNSGTWDGPAVLPNREYGWWISVCESDAGREQFESAGMSRAFFRLHALAKKKGCAWILLDRDAEADLGLPSFDW